MKMIAPASLALALLLVGCGLAPAAAPSSIGSFPIPVGNGEALQQPGTPEPPLIVAAAADLQFAFHEIAQRFEAETGTPVTLVFGSTGQLAQQIENGAPYDLFAAANISFVEQLAAKGLVREDSVALYARGRIVLAVNKASGLSVHSLEDLLDVHITRVAIANPEHAPYGLAARQALESAGLWEKIQPKIVRGENVRQALQYIQTGDCQAGIVALSVASVPEIDWVLIDQGLHAPLDQALAILTSSPRQELAAQFTAFINGEQGRPIMRRYGFILPDESPLLTSP